VVLCSVTWNNDSVDYYRLHFRIQGKSVNDDILAVKYSFEMTLELTFYSPVCQHPASALSIRFYSTFCHILYPPASPVLPIQQVVTPDHGHSVTPFL